MAPTSPTKALIQNMRIKALLIDPLHYTFRNFYGFKYFKRKIKSKNGTKSSPYEISLYIPPTKGASVLVEIDSVLSGDK